MGVVPARVAGVRRVVVATPPKAYAGSPELRWALRELGVREVLLAGGAHGVAGLVSVARVAKIVGPGNRFVAAAKHLVSSVVAVDLPAGPSEVLIVASADAPAGDVAADLLAQAEHDPDAVCLLFTPFAPLVRRVVRGGRAAARRSSDASKTARRSLARNGRAVVFASLGDAFAAGLRVAAEHVQVMGRAAARRRARRSCRRRARSSSARRPRRPSATTSPDRTTSCRPGAPRGASPASRSRDFVRWGRLVAVGRPRGEAARRPPRPPSPAFEGLAAHERSAARRRAVSGRAPPAPGSRR